MAMTITQQMASYLSKLELARAVAEIGEGAEPEVEQIDGAVLFVDISGFTRLTEQLAEQGPRAAELLTDVLDACFGFVITIVEEHGGDVLHFVGDAVLVLFPSSDLGDLESATALAVQSALAIQEQAAAAEPVAGIRVELRTTVGAGDLFANYVGGVDGRWLTVVGGAPLVDIFEADALNRPGRVQVSQRSWPMISDRFSGIEEDNAVIVAEVERPVELPERSIEKQADQDLSTLQPMVLPIVGQRLAHEQGDFLAEFRDLSVVFVNLTEAIPGDPTQVTALNEALVVIQEEIAAFEGTLYHAFRDDKGTSAVAAFGLPGQAKGDDDQARAVEAALAICRRLETAEATSAIGVTTGPVFCGAYGTDHRRHYGILGAAINRAARLMEAAPINRLLCDEETQSRSSRWEAFDEMPAIEAKGFAEPIRVFTPLGRRANARGRVASSSMVGRKHETELLRTRVAMLRDHGQGGVVVVEGEAGMGKTTVFSGLRDLLVEENVALFEGAADPIEQSTPYFALRPVFSELLDAEGLEGGPETEAAIADRVAALPEGRRELAPLLSTVLPFDMGDSELTSQMSGAIRAENLSNVLLGVLREFAAEAPFVIALEDLHWMDQASLVFCLRAVDHLPGVLLLLNSRPMDPEPLEYRQLSAGPGRDLMRLDSMAPDETIELVRRRLDVRSLPAAVKELILTRAEGNPFFSEELALSLIDDGTMTIVDGECVVDEAAGALTQLQLPGTVKGVLTNRIDRLDPPVQLTLKVASVVGRVFEVPVVANIHPVAADRPLVPRFMDVLADKELIVPQEARVPTDLFRHALTRETTYEMMTHAQRGPLHRAAAEHIETAWSADLSPYYGRLAFHFTEAEVPDKAIRYLSHAATQALGAYANQAAVDYLLRALELDQALRGDLAIDLQRARWHRQLCEAYYSLVEHGVARSHAEQAIELCGFTAPRFGWSTPGEIGRHLARRAAPGVFKPDPEVLSAEERDLSLEALRAADLLQVIHLWQGDRMSLAHTVIEGSNIGERVEPSAESAFARAMIGYLMAVGGLRGVAESDLTAAVEMAEDAGQLLQMVSCNMYLGMTYSLMGRPNEGIPYLERADELAGRLGAGLWKHRGKYMLAEPHMMTGRLEEAAEFFGESAALARGPEPPITGFANSMRALCWIRLGRVDEGLELVNGPAGIQLVRDDPLPLQLYNSLGALIDGYLWKGDYEAALPLAEEALTVASSGDDVNSFLTGYNGHLAVCRFFLSLLEAQQQGGDERELGRMTERALKNFKKGVRTFPAARPPYLVMRGWYEYLGGQKLRAYRTLNRVVDMAVTMEMPYEHALAEYELGRHLNGAERERRLTVALESFERHDMVLYAERCRRALVES